MANLSQAISVETSQAYAVLTVCRGLYAEKHSRQVSKHQAALWTAAEYPGWARLIRSALIWRSEWRNEDVDHASTYPEVSRFVRFATTRVMRQDQRNRDAQPKDPHSA